MFAYLLQLRTETENNMQIKKHKQHQIMCFMIKFSDI